MNKRKAVIAFLLACAGALAGPRGVRAAELTQINTDIPIQPGARIAVVSKNTKGQFWDLVRSGMQDALTAVNEAYGFGKGEQVYMTFEGPDDEKKVEDQINTIDAVLNENPDVLCLSVGDSNSCIAQIEAATENGIPVVVFDSNVNESGLVTAFRSTDNVMAGELAAEQLAQKISEGKVVIFSVQSKTESAQSRADGFCEKMKEYPDITVIDTIGQDEVEDMSASMAEILENTPDLKGVFCSNADVAELYLGLDAGLREGIQMVGVDATTRQQEAIKNGEELCTISQDPRTLGYETILTALLTTAPEEAEVEIPEKILLMPQMINADNLYNPVYNNYIYGE